MSWWEQFGLTAKKTINDSQLDEVYETFTSDGKLLSYYPVTMGVFVGTEAASPIIQMAIVMSRTMRIDNNDVSPEYFLGLKPSQWNEHVKHLEL